MIARLAPVYATAVEPIRITVRNNVIFQRYRKTRKSAEGASFAAQNTAATQQFSAFFRADVQSTEDGACFPFGLAVPVDTHETTYRYISFWRAGIQEMRGSKI